MSIEEAIMGGIVFKGKKDKPKEEEKVKTKAKKSEALSFLPLIYYRLILIKIDDFKHHHRTVRNIFG